MFKENRVCRNNQPSETSTPEQTAKGPSRRNFLKGCLGAFGVLAVGAVRGSVWEALGATPELITDPEAIYKTYQNIEDKLNSNEPLDEHDREALERAEQLYNFLDDMTANAMVGALAFKLGRGFVSKKHEKLFGMFKNPANEDLDPTDIADMALLFAARQALLRSTEHPEAIELADHELHHTEDDLKMLPLPLMLAELGARYTKLDLHALLEDDDFLPLDLSKRPNLDASAEAFEAYAEKMKRGYETVLPKLVGVCGFLSGSLGPYLGSGVFNENKKPLLAQRLFEYALTKEIARKKKADEPVQLEEVCNYAKKWQKEKFNQNGPGRGIGVNAIGQTYAANAFGFVSLTPIGGDLPLVWDSKELLSSDPEKQALFAKNFVRFPKDLGPLILGTSAAACTANCVYVFEENRNPAETSGLMIQSFSNHLKGMTNGFLGLTQDGLTRILNLVIQVGEIPRQENSEHKTGKWKDGDFQNGTAKFVEEWLRVNGQRIEYGLAGMINGIIQKFQTTDTIRVFLNELMIESTESDAKRTRVTEFLERWQHGKANIEELQSLLPATTSIAKIRGLEKQLRDIPILTSPGNGSHLSSPSIASHTDINFDNEVFTEDHPVLAQLFNMMGDKDKDKMKEALAHAQSFTSDQARKGKYEHKFSHPAIEAFNALGTQVIPAATLAHWLRKITTRGKEVATMTEQEFKELTCKGKYLCNDLISYVFAFSSQADNLAGKISGVATLFDLFAERYGNLMTADDRYEIRVAINKASMGAGVTEDVQWT